MKMIRGIAKWAHILKPNTKFENDRYEITLEVDENIYDAYANEVDFGHKMTEDGKYEIRIEQPVVNANGAPNKPPVLAGEDGKATNVVIGNGSEVFVKYRTFTYERGRKKGQTRSYLMGVQIINLVEYEGTDEDVTFDPI